MKVKKSDAVALLVKLGLKNAGSKDDAFLLDKLNGLSNAPKAQVKKVSEDKASGSLLKDILAALSNNKKVTLATDEKAPAGKTKPAPGKKAAKVEEPEEEEAEETEESEDETEEGDDDGEVEEDAEAADADESDEEAEEDDDGEAEESEEEPAVTKKTGKKAAPKEKKPKAAKAPVELDGFGNRKKDPSGAMTRTARVNAVFLGSPNKAFTTEEIQEKANATGIHSHLTKLKSLGYIKKVKRKADDKNAYMATGKKHKPAAK